MTNKKGPQNAEKPISFQGIKFKEVVADLLKIKPGQVEGLDKTEKSSGSAKGKKK